MKPSFILIVFTFVFVFGCYVRATVVPSSENDTTSRNLAPDNADPGNAILSAKERWKLTEKSVKKLMSGLVKKLLPMILTAREEMNLTAKCSTHLMRMIGGLKQLRLWAFKMLDSSGKIPNGVLTGTLTSLGNFDECLSVDLEGQFQGQYCTLEILPPLPPRRPFTSVDEEIPDFVNLTEKDTLIWDLMTKSQHYYYLNFRTSLCLPSTCNKQDVKSIAEKVIEEIEFGWDVEVGNCEVKKELQLDTSDIVIMCILGIFLTLALLGTTIDVIKKIINEDEEYKIKDGTWLKCLYCFSVYTNTVRLLKKDNSPDTIKIFHGMKVITLMWVILNHTYYYVNLEIFGSLMQTRGFGKDIAFQFVLNGFLNVETFFFISAVLVAYGRMKSKDRDFTAFTYAFRRLWRLTPPFMMVIAFTFLIRHMGSGPVWEETVGHLVDRCKKNWWTNLLYYNNLINSENMCLQWTWYIPVDTHLYFLSFFVLLPLKHRPRLAFFILGLIFVTSTSITAYFHYRRALPPTAIYAFSHPDDINHFVDYGYFRTYLHAVTYCVGMCVGYLIHSQPKLRVPVLINVFGWIVAFVSALTVLYGVYDWNQGRPPSLIISTVYQCTNKFVWALALGWVTVICYTGNGGIVNSILSWNAFVPLSRLTYMTYLIHPIIQHMYVGSTRVILQTEHKTFSFLFLGNVVASFIVAYVFSQLFESPFMALEKVMFSRRLQAQSTKQSTIPEEKPGGGSMLYRLSRFHEISNPEQQPKIESGKTEAIP